MPKKPKSPSKPQLSDNTIIAGAAAFIVLLIFIWAWNNPISTGILVFLGLIVVGIIAVGHYFGGGILGLVLGRK